MTKLCCLLVIRIGARLVFAQALFAHFGTGDVFCPLQSGDSYLSLSLAAAEKHKFICDLPERPERTSDRRQSGSLVNAAAAATLLTLATRIGLNGTCGGN